MAKEIKVLPKDVWTKVLENVTYYGSVYILDQDDEPTEYKWTLVAAGDPVPDSSYAGGVVFDQMFAPANTTAADYCVKPGNSNGLVEVFT